MTLSQEGPLLFMVIRVTVFTGLHLGLLCSLQDGQEGVILRHLPSKCNSPMVFWSEATSLVSAVLEVIELAFKRLGGRLPAGYGVPISVVITLLKAVYLEFS